MRLKLSRTKINEVISRQRNKCRRCSTILDQIDINIDHIVPLSEGGTSDLGNLQALCGSCRNKKSHEDRLRKNNKSLIRSDKKKDSVIDEISEEIIGVQRDMADSIEQLRKGINDSLL